MFSDKEKRFFIETARGVAKLSNCSIGRGAVLVKNNNLISCGYNRSLLKNGIEEDITAIESTISCAGPVSLIDTDTDLFCTYFPTNGDLIRIVSTGISNVRFLGDATDQDTVDKINLLIEDGVKLNFIQIQFD